MSRARTYLPQAISHCEPTRDCLDYLAPPELGVSPAHALHPRM